VSDAAVPTPSIEAIDVGKAFDRGVVRALDGATFTVRSAEYVTITGPSGSGKSTLLSLIAALDRPDSGTLRVARHDIARLRDADAYRRAQVGLVFQLHNLLPYRDAQQNVEIAMIGTGTKRRDERTRAAELLASVGLEGYDHRRPPEMSGGERQRVAIARALANRPSLLLADEPTGSLDSASVRMVLDLLRRLRDEQHVTIVVVTHDPTVAAAADRVIYLRDGRVEERDGSSRAAVV
jgi:putative ABC transport system ATP-binding protein